MNINFFLLFVIIALIPLSVFALIGEGISDSSILDTVNPLVIVNYPNGGENLYIGNSANITWLATDYSIMANSINIFYSNNNGVTYNILDSLETNDGNYEWQFPSIISYNNLIKINTRDSFGNIGNDSSDNVFSILYEPPASPVNVNVDLSNNSDAIISWTAVDTTIFGNTINIDGYIVLYNETAYEDSLHYYYYLANTNNNITTYTHFGVVAFRDQMFYKVVAYKDYRGKVNQILSKLSNMKIKWAELQRRFR